MNKAGKVATTVVVLAGVGAGAYYLIGPKGVIGPGGETEKNTVAQVDSVNKVLTMRIDSLEAEIKAPTNTVNMLDSLADVLVNVNWTPVQDGGDYEAKSKELFMAKKQEAIGILKGVYEQNRVTELPEVLKQEIKE